MIKMAYIAMLLPLVAYSQTSVGGFVFQLISSPAETTNAIRKEIDVVVWAGQSNCLGYPNEIDGFGTTGPSLPERLQIDQPKVRSWNKTYSTWSNEKLRPASSRYWGAEITCMDKIVTQYNQTMAIVKVAYGSTSLHPRTNAATHWSKPSTRYSELTNYVAMAKTTLEAEGFQTNFKQFVWIQGEDDTLLQESADAYYDNFITFWQNFCADTGIAESTRVIIAPLPSQYTGGYASVVKQKQALLAELNENISLVSVLDLPYYSGVHYSAQSYMVLGERIADLYLGEFGKTPKPYALTNGTFFLE